MLTLPKTKRDPKKVEGLCTCRPICKSRRREWKGLVLLTSEELLIERKPIPECIRRRPREIKPNGPCPLHGKTKHLSIRERNVDRRPKVVRICQAPLDIGVDTPYLDLVANALQLGALPLTGKTCCAFCDCSGCCDCSRTTYQPKDAERAARRRAHMREFDRRVRGIQESRIMSLLEKHSALPLTGKTCCAFCDCSGCCDCSRTTYQPKDAERAARRRAHMREFDRRVRGIQESRIMYDL
ncbi:uncharacterized protein LOC125233534 [Leguminivora glycinivorella]|uniref:uncharacterized protein LOC125233534 n=1 Tax=Leguminivora glycinivorella TaxID=1035111 RepID=UPI00200E3F21|nr:uncharacterized protein LOC125233534 [Leguminivora glycinivorella]